VLGTLAAGEIAWSPPNSTGATMLLRHDRHIMTSSSINDQPNGRRWLFVDYYLKTSALVRTLFYHDRRNA